MTSRGLYIAGTGTGVGKTLGYLAPASLWAEEADGAVWIGHAKRRGGMKLPAAQAFPEALALPASTLEGWWKSPAATWQDIAYEEAERHVAPRGPPANGPSGVANGEPSQWNAYRRPAVVSALEASL